MTPLPHNAEVEQHVLSVCMKDEGVTYKRAIEAGVTEDSFYDPHNVYVWQAFARMPFPDSSLLAMEGDKIGGSQYAFQVDSKEATTLHAGHLISQLLELQAKRTIIREAHALIEHASNGTTMEELAEQAKKLVPESRVPSDWKSRRVSLASPPSEPSVRLFLAGKKVATPGNLVTIISRAKTGKTATLGGVVAAIVGAHYDRQDLDALGFTAPHTSEAVVLIDTEQSPYDAWTCHQRTMARAKQPDDPAWLCHYALVSYSAKKLRETLPKILKKCLSDHKGIFTLILDGVADFVCSVNDEVECNDFISWLRALSIEYNCPIICVIHSNEGIKNGDDGRGWLGKELTRKAESNLLLKKVGEITTITSDKQRHAPIVEADGIAFKWSDELHRHTLCAPAVKAKAGKPKLHCIQDFLEVIPAKGQPGKTGTQLHRYASGLKEIKIQTFRDLLNDASRDGVLIRSYDETSGYSYTKSI